MVETVGAPGDALEVRVRRVSGDEDLSRAYRLLASLDYGVPEEAVLTMFPSPSALQDRIRSGIVSFYVAEEGDGGDVVGVAAVVGSAQPFNRDQRVVALIGVRPDRRGRGVGSALLRAVVRDSEAEGVRKLVAQVPVENVASAALFLKSGFRFESYLRDAYGIGRDSYVMALRMGGDGA